MEINVTTIQDQIPYYLTQPQKEALTKELKHFNKYSQIYLYSDSEDHTLQGDGWGKLEVIKCEERDQGPVYERKSVLGIILSNTCDINPDNSHDFPPKISFAPVIPLAAYVKALEQAGIDAARIEKKIDSIKNQSITKILYLRAGAGLEEDHIALFEDLHSMPTAKFYAARGRRRIFRLNMVGFYLFILKLSVHFCRLQENFARD